MTRSTIAASLATISVAWPPSSCTVGRPSAHPSAAQRRLLQAVLPVNFVEQRGCRHGVLAAYRKCPSRPPCGWSARHPHSGHERNL